MDHETIGELHGLGTGGTKLSRDNDFTTLGTGLHNETENTIASPNNGCSVARRCPIEPILPADSETVEELVPQTLTLCDGGETTVLNLLGIHLERVFGETETFLDESSKLTDPATLFAQDFLGVSSTNDNLADRDMFRASRKFFSRRLTSVRAWVTRTSQPEYPSSESSRVKKSLSSARKTPSATNFLLLLIWADILAGAGYMDVDESDGYRLLSVYRPE